MVKQSNFEIDLEISRLEIKGIDKILDIVKLTISIGTPTCVLLLSQKLEDWWQIVAFGILAGVVLGAFIELFNLTHKRNDILLNIKKKYVSEKRRPINFLKKLSGRKDST